MDFLLPLAIALVAIYIHYNSAEEISYLFALISIVSVLLTLVLAPWQMQVGLLIVALVVSRTKLSTVQPGPSVGLEEDEGQKVIYRGFTYEYNNSTVEKNKAQIAAKDRSNTLNLLDSTSSQPNFSLNQSSQSLPVKLIYRGSTYEHPFAKIQ